MNALLPGNRGTFYIDCEWTNGNYYTGDIFEIACLYNVSNNIFHSYINIDTDIPYYIQRLCNVKPSMLRKQLPFHEVIDRFIKFIQSECDTIPTLVAHGGYTQDFPLLTINCMKHQCNFTRFKSYQFIDSIQAFSGAGFTRSGMDSLLQVKRRYHSAVHDGKLLRWIITHHRSIEYHIYQYEDILQHIDFKMPISISELHGLATNSETR